jgi:hypothetical protein
MSLAVWVVHWEGYTTASAAWQEAYWVVFITLAAEGMMMSDPEKAWKMNSEYK